MSYREVSGDFSQGLLFRNSLGINELHREREGDVLATQPRPVGVSENPRPWMILRAPPARTYDNLFGGGANRTRTQISQQYPATHQSYTLHRLKNKITVQYSCSVLMNAVQFLQFQILRASSQRPDSGVHCLKPASTDSSMFFENVQYL